MLARGLRNLLCVSRNFGQSFPRFAQPLARRTKVLCSPTTLADNEALRLTPYRGHTVFAPDIWSAALQKVNPIGIGGECQLY
jgi:hypothetical protein